MSASRDPSDGQAVTPQHDPWVFVIRGLARAFPYFLLAPAVLPLVVVDGLLYPHLAPKTLLFRCLGILAFASFTALALAARPFFFSRLRNPWSWIPAALLGIAYASSLAGVDFDHSFWSTFQRGDGLLTFTVAVSFFYLTLLHADVVFIRRLLVAVALSASLVALIGGLQWVQASSGIDVPLVPATTTRIGSTLGHGAYLGTYLGLTLFVVLAVIPSLSGRWRVAARAGAALHVLAIVATATRASLLALMAAAFVSLVYVARKAPWRHRAYARAAVVAALLVAGCCIAFRAELASVPFRPVARLASLSLQDRTVASRLFIWRNVLPAAFARPLGVGAEQIETVYNRFYDPTAIREEWFDRTHNAALDYLVQYGPPGLLLYLALIGAFVRQSVGLASSAPPDEARRGRLFLLFGLVYVMQNAFMFDTAITLWLFLALTAVALATRSTEGAAPLRVRRAPGFVAAGAGFLLALLVIPVSWTPLRANILLARSYGGRVFDVRHTREAITRGYSLGTYADLDYGYQLYRMYTDREMRLLSHEERVLAFRLARHVLAQNRAAHPYDGRTAIYYVHLLDAAPERETLDDDDARGALEHAIELSPKRVQPWSLLAKLAVRRADAEPPGSAKRREYYQDAIRELTAYAKLVPTLAEPRYMIANLYLALGDSTRARQWAQEGRALYEPDEATARRAVPCYVRLQDWENARFFLREVLKADPTDYAFLYDLAKVEFLAGRVERASAIVADLRAKSPGLVETDSVFLQALGRQRATRGSG